ncbi:MAG TPA: iron ABC transporter permease, partial [Gammaproteobacteria bacterium]|nr:iron ABC transporter permease [Gammaproteobacteria bacterium]
MVVIPTQTLKSPLFIWAGLCAGLVILPVLWLATSWAEIRADLWQHLIETQILELIWNTLRLILGVFIGVSLLGTSLAWIVTKYEFPGRSFFEWALVLPF